MGKPQLGKAKYLGKARPTQKGQRVQALPAHSPGVRFLLVLRAPFSTNLDDATESLFERIIEKYFSIYARKHKNY